MIISLSSRTLRHHHHHNKNLVRQRWKTDELSATVYLFIWGFDCSPFMHNDNTRSFTETKDIHNSFTLLFIIPEEFLLIIFCGEYHTWLPSLNVHVQDSFDSSLLIVILSFSKDESPGIQCMSRASSTYHSSFLSCAITGFGESLSALGFITPLL